MSMKWIGTLLSAVLLCTGCEALVPVLISEAAGGSDSTDFEPVELRVEVTSAQGNLDGTRVNPEMLDASGEQFAGEISLHIQSSQAPDSTIEVSTQGDGSSQNPYGGGGGDSFGRGFDEPAFGPDGGVGGGFEGDERGALAPEPFAAVTRCSGTRFMRSCEAAQDFDLTINETPDGRIANIDGVWSGGDEIHLTLRLSEN